jgi:hypothetical protein
MSSSLFWPARASAYFGISVKVFSATDSTFGREKNTGKYFPRAQSSYRSR